MYSVLYLPGMRHDCRDENRRRYMRTIRGVLNSSSYISAKYFFIHDRGKSRPAREQSPICWDIFPGRIFRVTEGAHPSRWLERGVLYARAVPRRFSFRENKLPPITSTLSRYIEQMAAIRRRSWATVLTTRRKIRFRARIRGRVDLKVQ